ncbi:uncharacterized protein LOC121871823 [Homarus americanus]|nr:uncharacterized protein LOC121871823 [Homarus americanus]
MEHPSQLTVDNKPWDNNYCHRNSAVFLELLNMLTKLYLAAAQEANLDSFQRCEIVSVAGLGTGEVCSATLKVKRDVKTLPNGTAGRWVVNDAGEEERKIDGLMIKNNVIMRDTDTYTKDTAHRMKRSLVKVVEDKEFTQELGLEIPSEKIDFEGPTPNLCGSRVVCLSPQATCRDVKDPELEIQEGQCFCNTGLEDFSPQGSTGEVCASPCLENFCGYGGYCQHTYTYELECKCSSWYYSGEKCTYDMRVVIGVVASVLSIVLVLAGAALYWRRRRRRGLFPILSTHSSSSSQQEPGDYRAMNPNVTTELKGDRETPDQQYDRVEDPHHHHRQPRVLRIVNRRPLTATNTQQIQIDGMTDSSTSDDFDYRYPGVSHSRPTGRVDFMPTEQQRVYSIPTSPQRTDSSPTEIQRRHRISTDLPPSPPAREHHSSLAIPRARIWSGLPDQV